MYAVEPNPSRLETIKAGRSFFFEEGLDVLIKSALDNGSLIPTDSYANSVKHSFAVFSCVGTPDNPDGSSNLEYVMSAAKQAAQYMQPGAIYIQKSTVPVGTGLQIIAIFDKLGVQAPYISNPEFLREGTAVHDTLYFDRIVAGGDDKDAVETVLGIYQKLEESRDKITKLSGVSTGNKSGQYMATSLNSAELIKVAANAFLAMKISFANSIARLSDAVDADIVEVMDAVGADARIGRSFLNAGRGYGGGCFPKDVSGLIASGLKNGVELELIQATQSLNDSMPGYIVKKLHTALGGIKNKKIAILGLAFKAGTSDVRRSPGVTIANILAQSGATVTTYDPQAQEQAAEWLYEGISQNFSINDALAGVDAVVIATDWPEILTYPPTLYAKTMKGAILMDAVNALSRHRMESHNLTYIGVGR